MSKLCIKGLNEIIVCLNPFLFENFFQIHECWLRNVKHVTDIMYTPNL